MDRLDFIGDTFSFKVGQVDIAPTYWQALLIVVLLFLLVWSLARLRYLYVHWSLGKSSIAMLFWGFLLALILEGFLLIGGRTMFTVVLGWENAPKPFSTALDMGREKLVNVLGVTDEVPSSSAKEKATGLDLVEVFKSLEKDEAEKVKTIICQP